MRKLFLRLALAALATLPVCARADTPGAYTAIIEQSGVVVCSKLPSVSCELSAVAWVRNGDDGYLVFGNDKPPKSDQESSIFSMPYAGSPDGVFQGNGPRSFYTFPPFLQASKFESMSVTPDGRYAIAATAFDRYNEADSALDKFNTLVFWPVADPQKAQIVSSSHRDGIESSRRIKSLLGKTIRNKFGEQAEYFKMEGLALLPDNRIIFGIREIGRTYTAFDYHVTLIEGKYAIRDGVFTLDEKTGLEVIRDFSEVAGIVGKKVGLSDIGYDANKKRLYVLTTFESDEEKSLSAYLWVLPDNNDGSLGASLQLVRTSDGWPFELPHKAEGLALLGDGRLFIVHDDDRNMNNVRIGGKNGSQLRARKPNEAPFDILKVCSEQNALTCRATISYYP